ncbi:hypothetical protein MNBD_ALPHA09-2153 [hydrothermal vent metagenome]|uniref:Uncharacterized protein n=1 Tax=hydrothermal vent metagenome TaxID=652676 RepID=A0A3B0TE93_9ZZZZ
MKPDFRGFDAGARLILRSVLSLVFLTGGVVSLVAEEVAPAGARGPGLFIEAKDELGGFEPLNLATAFAGVFRALPDEVQVRPAGNHFYFAYSRAGAVRHGNFRLDAADRDRGVIHFALDGENGPAGRRGRAFGRGDGVKVTGVTPFIYVVHFDGKAVVFRLNELAGVAPGEVSMRGGETYLGPVEDDSGLGFFLLWHEAAKRFFFILDEARLAEPLERTAVSGRLRIGVPSGFAFYRDRYTPRWILVGVRRGEVARNGIFDGPFDRMPDNLLVGEALKRALVAARPELKGRIERFGNSADLKARVLVRPYILYDEPDELAVFDSCAARAAGPKAYYRCFATGLPR